MNSIKKLSSMLLALVLVLGLVISPVMGEVSYAADYGPVGKVVATDVYTYAATGESIQSELYENGHLVVKPYSGNHKEGMLGVGFSDKSTIKRTDVISLSFEPGVIVFNNTNNDQDPGILKNVDKQTLKHVDFTNLDMSKVRSLGGLFKDFTALESVEFGNIDTRNVSNMQRMFEGASRIKSVDMSNIQTSDRLENMRMMFKDTTNLEEIKLFPLVKKPLSDVDVIGNSSLYAMFQNAKALKAIDFSSWINVVPNGTSSMFQGASSLKELDLTMINMEMVGHDFTGFGGLQSMFASMTSLEKLDISTWDLSKANKYITSSDPSTPGGLFLRTPHDGMFARTPSLKWINLPHTRMFNTYSELNAYHYDRAILPTPQNESGKWVKLDGTFTPLTSQDIANKMNIIAKNSEMPGIWVWERSSTTQEETRTEVIPFEKTVVEDAEQYTDYSEVTTIGVDGEKTIVEKVTYMGEEEISRELISEEITKEPINEVTTVGTKPIISNMEETRTELIPFEKTVVEDAEQYTDYSEVTTAGVNGEKSITERITYNKGEEVSREIVSEEVTIEPITEVITVGTRDIVEIIEETRIEAIPYETEVIEDNTLLENEEVVDVEGENGEKVVTELITYTKGVETAREYVSEEITVEPITKVVRVGTMVIEEMEETRTEVIPFEKTVVEDAEQYTDYSEVTTVGVDGEKTIVERVTYTNGEETGRVIVSEEITTEPITEITTIGTKEIITFEEVKRTEIVPFSTQRIDDPTLPVGQEVVDVEGVNGEKVVIENVSYNKGVEASREIISEEVTVEPITRVIRIGTMNNSMEHTPVVEPVHGEVGEEINPIDGITNKDELPEGTEYEVISDPIDTTQPGEHEAIVKVTYPDGSTEEVTVPVVIKDSKTDAEKYDPVVEPVNGEVGEEVNPIDGITNKDELPEGTEYEVISDPIDTTQPGEHEAIVKVTYPDGSTEEVTVPVVIKDSKTDAEKYDPVVEPVNGEVGEEVNPIDGITNKDELPEGTEYEVISDPIDTTQPGEHEAIVKVTYPDGSTEEVTVPVVIKDSKTDADKYNPKASNIIIEKGGSYDLLDGITNKKELPVGTVLRDITKTNAIDVNKVGEYIGQVEVRYPDGSKETVDVKVIVKDSSSASSDDEKPVVEKDDDKKPSLPKTGVAPTFALLLIGMGTLGGAVYTLKRKNK